MSAIDVSVVIAVKNEQLHIESALASVLAQTGVDFELILVDDGSTDATHEKAAAMASRDARLRVERNPKAGKCSAFNYGVSLARGRFVCIFAGDDIMPTASLAARWERVKGLSDDVPGVGLCKLTTMSEVKKLNGHVIPRAPGRGALSGVSPLMNKLALNAIFPVPEILPNEDTWMELAVLHMPGWNVVHSDIIGCNWRLHSGNSINMLVGFQEYNKKITVRMKAYSLFYDRHGHEMESSERAYLLAKVNCEASRMAGDVVGVLRSRVRLVERLRALSITNAFFYEIRRRLYGLLSGW